ncbi:hypothetical protein QO001_005602 [Methylobacterium brachiatum]|uniref:Uncharacterized protein n=1 Tax=Methylobacterium brachiatum TaxID=269660 RepID=A0AAJ1TTM6_9HYPH|nr:hypothetical protein [Methylobacterium brachiatum]MCB4806194.1 hypothetical protein [Methylobacterium brachiatum]MDQ0546650.1 hypothetical protein [Methylobacterium brachiatum]
MTTPPQSPVASAADTATRILAVADRDVTFILRVVGESQQTLVEHFQSFIEESLNACGIGYGDHPLLRPFVDTHARELAEFVHNGIALRHRFGLRDCEAANIMPPDLRRVDLWDDLRSLIEQAEAHFAASPQGLPAILAEVTAFQESRRKDDADA